MEFVGGTFVFNFRKLFDAGLINQNCVIEVEGKHYVFDSQDVYVHDGTTKQSICDERTKNFIFQSLNTQKSDVCFVQHNDEPERNLLLLLQWRRTHVAFPNATRCNRAASIFYRNNTWTFYDLPNVSAGTTANVNSVTTYANATALLMLWLVRSYFDQAGQL